jgi:hypothetical protein
MEDTSQVKTWGGEESDGSAGGGEAWQEALSAGARGTSLYCCSNPYREVDLDRNYCIATICHDKVILQWW